LFSEGIVAKFAIGENALLFDIRSPAGAE